ncbi:hypothetical protein ABMC89_06140 [Sulfitobacter sp. HNIBRBA3233]|uniref:hypothetical protein n=1 Tax=Sulfitobacter marinivivus TaxID=3158558 RepID=UPI0032E013D5
MLLRFFCRFGGLCLASGKDRSRAGVWWLTARGAWVSRGIAFICRRGAPQLPQVSV